MTIQSAVRQMRTIPYNLLLDEHVSNMYQHLSRAR